jgi:hypothetical protein
MARVGIAQCVDCSQVYEATGWRERVCDHCRLPYGESLHDPCLGTLEGVTEACCGHGDPSRAYMIRGGEISGVPHSFPVTVGD